MNKKKTIAVLCAPTDEEALAPVLEVLRARGLKATPPGTKPEKGQIVLAALTEHFYADADKCRALLELVGAGEETLPLQLDDAPMPRELKNALYARNIIPAAGRDTELLAERVMAALPKEKNRLPAYLTAATAAVALLAGVLIWNGMRGEEPSAPAMAEQSASENIYIPEGVTQEELARVWDVVITGDRLEMFTAEEAKGFGYVTAGNGQISVNWPGYDFFAYRSWEDDDAHYYSREDSHEYTMAVWEDLRFLALMPNLHRLSLARVDPVLLPDLTGADKLESVELMDTAVGDLKWLEGSSLKTLTVFNSTGSLSDFGPLTGCEKLESVTLDLVHTRTADLSGFAPPNLKSLWLKNGSDLQTLDLSAVSGCKKLRECRLEGELPVRDLSFLEGLKLQVLMLNELSALRDISALRTMPSVGILNVEFCLNIRDYTPIGGCSALKTFMLHTDGAPLRDASFLAGLKYLKDIGLYGVALRDMDFLATAAGNGAIRLGFAGDIQDYSGLTNIRRFEYLHVNPRSAPGSRYGDLSAVLPYIQDAVVDQLMLYNCRNIDLGALPLVRQDLDICYSELTDLTGLRDFDLQRLFLEGCPYLTSLEGIQALGTFAGRQGKPELFLDIYNCPRLTDWSALEGADLRRLEVRSGYTLPDLGSFRTGELWLENIADMTDLHCLDALRTDTLDGLALVKLDQVRDLSPVFRHRGEMLLVPPHLAEQARELVEAGNFEFYEVAYPDEGAWDPLDEELELLSLEELNTLPKALLRRVTRLCIAGDRLFDWEEQEIHDRWEKGRQIWYIRDRQTGQETDIPRGTIADMSVLSSLTGLRELELYCQPLTDLSGIQNLSSLEKFYMDGCPGLTDASPLFAVSTLEEISLKGSGIDSIQGIQNLDRLTQLDVSNTRVRDLSPLAACDFSAAREQGGFHLSMNELELTDESLAALASVGRFADLTFTDQDPAVWIPLLADTEIYAANLAGDLRSNEDLAAFAADHPELRRLGLQGMEELTDLTCLLALEDLEYVHVSEDMRAAVESLDGADCGFELDISD